MPLKRVFALMLALCLCAGLLSAQAAASVTVSAELGYHGLITYLYPMPLRVAVSNHGSDAQLTVAVNVNRNNIEYDRYEYPITLAGGAQMNLSLPLTLNYKQDAYAVEVLEGEQVVARCDITPQQMVSPRTLLVGVLSETPEAVSYMSIGSDKDALLRGERWQTVSLSAETFPSDIESLSAFKILAVDGVDVTALSAAQRETLDAWLRAGGIIFVGGGAAGTGALRGFAPYTGVTAAAPYQATGVEKALYAYFGNTLFPMTNTSSPAVSGNREVMLSSLRGGNAVVTLDGSTLIDRCEVDAGVIYTTAFSLSEKPLALWSGMGEIWQRLLLDQDQSHYQQIIDQLNAYYHEGVYADQYLLQTLPIENNDQVLPVLLVIALFILLGGVGSYLILKKFDKREWMWVSVPALALLSAAALCLIGDGMQLGKPAMSAYSLISVDKNGGVERVTMAGVSTAISEPYTISAAGNESVYPGEDYDVNNYIDPDEDYKKREKELRYRYTLGEKQKMTMAGSQSPWTTRYVRVEAAPISNIDIAASIWWEEDGLHGEIENRSDIALSDGYVLTEMGFCSVPALLPGEKAEIALKKNENREEEDYKAADGELLSDMYAYSFGIYSIVDEAVYAREKMRAGEVSWTQEESLERRTRAQLIQSNMNDWGNFGIFRYVTFSDTLGRVGLEINGREIERCGYRAMIDVEMKHRAVGESGIVRLTRGMIPFYSATVDSNGRPTAVKLQKLGYDYYPLRDEPVLCFALGEVEGMTLDAVTIEKASLLFEHNGVNPYMYLYDFTQDAWMEVNYNTTPVMLKGEQIENCLDAQGRLFIRFKQRTGEYGEIYNPMLTVEGRAK